MKLLSTTEKIRQRVETFIELYNADRKRYAFAGGVAYELMLRHHIHPRTKFAYAAPAGRSDCTRAVKVDGKLRAIEIKTNRGSNLQALENPDEVLVWALFNEKIVLKPSTKIMTVKQFFEVVGTATPKALKWNASRDGSDPHHSMVLNIQMSSKAIKAAFDTLPDFEVGREYTTDENGYIVK